ncbi:Gfo/Idh/MocA family oxidoreductase [Coraliomargarita algicola]|uniref:Gfo/Idh/MocA family oxidoreductase n=1 Tax=Coraliomargarita algicola TaxID=3092156 RepID=A0ABZ0RKX4_9BACT|nr:Gfo/Idh/MocA family oxidoreductase [Coraliomargarita sp. J2-16]WPJ95572.1 Gfo/Idh/MocA family oxidoreductase [Coraliomargarita sp. J2-16]
MSQKFRSAIIGLGPCPEGKGGAHSISYSHAEAHQKTAGIELVAVCSRQQKNVDDFINEFPGCRGYVDYRALLTAEKPDWVVVSAYASSREEMVMCAIENAAKVVWIEKPLALSLGAARRMMSAAQAAGVRLFVSYQRRYGLPFEWFRAAAGKIGEVQSVDIVQPISNMLDFGPHQVDAALSVFGDEVEIASVFGATDWTKPLLWHGTQHEQFLLGCVRLSNGCRITIEAGPHEPNRLPILRVNGSAGFAELQLSPRAGEGSVFRLCAEGANTVSSPSTSEHYHHGDDPNLYMNRAVADVYDAVHSGRSTHLDVEKAYLGLKMLLGIYASAQARRLLGPEALEADLKMPEPSRCD